MKLLKFRTIQLFIVCCFVVIFAVYFCPSTCCCLLFSDAVFTDTKFGWEQINLNRRHRPSSPGDTQPVM